MIRVQREDFDVGAEIERLTKSKHDIGGVVSFVGLVRDLAGGAKIGAMTTSTGPADATAHRWRRSTRLSRESPMTKR